MEFKLNFDIAKTRLDLTHKDSVVLLGSCFSDEMTGKFQSVGFDVLGNPFGTLFHPQAIVNVLNAALDEKQSIETFHRADLFFSWDSASKIYGKSPAELQERLIVERLKLKAKLQHASVLVVTLGTATGYLHKEFNYIVGNCHKAPADTFEKVLSTVEELQSEWYNCIRKLTNLNPNLKILFTVSPVRHKKDGLIENNRSKARLIELVHELTEIPGVSYFPAYEILIDELRDYRFYASDLVHPSAEAVNYIWEQFSAAVFSPETLGLNQQVKLIKMELNHRSLHPDSLADANRITTAKQKQASLASAHPEIVWR